MTTPAARLSAALADRYAIEREVGAGGMATVWLATDLRHGRRVAIKVLRADIAAHAGAERFLREIRTTANLQHPHIVPLFDSGEADGTVFYVMPFIEGETLRDRLEREGQLPVSDAVRIAREVADALDYAHRQGLVHRDVKPENVLLHDNRVMVADFGIALALARSSGDVRLTETGMSVGTPHYMSPEQAMGERHITARTDIFALGAMLYEMLAGEPPFTGESAQVIVARMLTTAPTPIATLRPTVPVHVSRAIDGALQKVAADRFASAAAFAEALDTRTGDTASGSGERPAAAGSTRRRWLPTGAALLAALGVGATLPRLLGRPATGAAPVTRAVLPLARDQLLSTTGAPVAISRDGTFIVYAADDSGNVQLFTRALADTLPRVLAGTDGASSPLISPDGEWVAFFAHGQLQRVPRRGGAAIALAPIPGGEVGGDWGQDGTILYALGDGSLWRLNVDGGTPALVPVIPDDTARRRAFGPLRFPAFLPGDTRALVSSDSGVAVLDLTTGAAHVVTRGRQGTYLANGLLLFDDNEGRIRTAPFDVRRGAITGSSVPVFEAFRGSGGGPGYFSVSANGTLLYMPGGFQRTLVRVDRNGRETPINVKPRGYRFPSVSPDGRLIAVTVDPRPSSIWLVDPALGTAVPLTTDGIHSIHPIWSPDGSKVAYVSYRQVAKFNSVLMMIRAQPGAQKEVAFRPRSTERQLVLGVSFWTQDNSLLGYAANRHPGQTDADITRFPIGDTTLVPVVTTLSDERRATLSRDGQWLAYASDITGANEVYVRAYDGSGSAIQLSERGGTEPAWSADGTELFYRTGTRIMAVGVRTAPTFVVTRKPQLLFNGGYDFSQDDNWSLSPDGTFVMVKGDPEMGRQLRIVVNWFTELRQLTASTSR